MQGAYLTITIGIQFFILVGYLFYLIFRSYQMGEDRIALMRWTSILIGFLTFWLLVSILFVIPAMSQADLVMTAGLLIADFIGLYLLVDDTRRLANQG
jgi:hypothetical protein